MSSRTVLMYGHSPMLSRVADSMEQLADLCVTRATTWTEASQQMARGMPDALIFDLAGGGPSHILPLLLTRPDLLLIGLDADGNRAVLVSRQEARSLTLDQIREYVAGAAVRR